MTTVTLALIVGLALPSLLPTPAQARNPVVALELGDEGATSWNLSCIKPGDSGTKTVELHNAGSKRGFVTIWVSAINETDCAGDGATLDDYLLFNLSSTRLKTNIPLPATIHELPQGVSDADYVDISPLSPGETTALVWEWEFPEKGEPQNEAQGDRLTFTINYLLDEFPPDDGGGDDNGPSYRILSVDILGKATNWKVSSSGRLLYSYVATDPENKCSLELDKGTRVTCAGGRVPRRIEIKVCNEPLSAPDDMQVIRPAYDLIGYINDSVPCSAIFNQPARLTLCYDPSSLPANTCSILIASHDAEQGWTELEAPCGNPAEPGKITALISHGSTLAIMAKLAPSFPAPAEFKLSGLAINPAQTEVRGPVTISVIVQNTGQLEGSYTLTLRINGEIEQSKETALAGGESTQVSFTVIEHEPGTYAITVNGLTGEFTVLAPASSLPWISIHWWIALLAAIIIGLMVYFLATRPRHHS